MHKESDRIVRWRSLIDEYRQSGLTQPTFCERKQISYRQFLYYLMKFRKENRFSKEKNKQPPHLASVKLVSNNHATDACIHIRFQNGASCQLPAQLFQNQLCILLQEISRC